jgi:murein DD-endopeptidase MepM/ murein hydrolase activator NlpD
VRYLRLSRLHLTLLSALVLGFVFLVALATGVAPRVVGELFGNAEYRALAGERARQGERLEALVARLERLRERSEMQLLGMRQVSAAYGLAGEPAAISSPAPGPAAAAESPSPGSIYTGPVLQGDRLRDRISRQLAAVEAGLGRIAALERDHPDQVRQTPAICPLHGGRYVLSNPFGRQRSAFTRDLSFHAGIDLAAPRGTPILAPADGVVVFAGTYPLGRSAVWWRYGNLVAVAHGERFLTLYGHCGELAVAAGRTVRRGDRLGVVGSSGWSLSPHLHYEVRQRTAGGALVPVEPLLYILDRHWPNEERLLAAARGQQPRGFEPLPPGLEQLRVRGR